jgi:hypothetical protein
LNFRDAQPNFWQLTHLPEMFKKRLPFKPNILAFQKLS